MREDGRSEQLHWVFVLKPQGSRWGRPHGNPSRHQTRGDVRTEGETNTRNTHSTTENFCSFSAFCKNALRLAC